MLNRTLVCLSWMLAMSLWLCLALPAQAQNSGDPELDAVKQQYSALLRDYFARQNQAKPPSALPFALKNNMLSTSLGKLIQRDEKYAAKRGEVGKLDFDFLLNAQDVPEKLDIVNAARTGDSIRLSVETGEPSQGYVMVLIKEKDRWVMDDALYPKGASGPASLQRLLK